MPPAPSHVPVFGEARAVRRWIRSHRTDAARFVTPEAAGDEPAVCVAIERFPEEWSHERVRALLDRFPLAGWAIACGPWADGGARTGSPWPIALRCGDAEAVRRVLGALRGEPIPGPLGGGEPAPAPPAEIGRVKVFSPDRVYRETAERLWSGPGPAIWEAWDLDAWDDRHDAALTRSRLRHPERVRIGVSSFDQPPSRTRESVLDHLTSPKRELRPSAQPTELGRPPLAALAGRSLRSGLVTMSHRTPASGLGAVVGKWDPAGAVWDAVQSLSVESSSGVDSS